MNKSNEFAVINQLRNFLSQKDVDLRFFINSMTKRFEVLIIDDDNNTYHMVLNKIKIVEEE